jgi:hypothetical protein
MERNREASRITRMTVSGDGYNSGIHIKVQA